MDINICAPINQLGYGITSLNIVKQFILYGHKVCLFDIGPRQLSTEEDKSILNKLVSPSDFFVYAPSLRIWHQNDMAMRVGRGLHCGFPIFELDRFTHTERQHLQSLDIIFVASKWAYKICSNEFQTPITLAPLGVDRQIFNDNVPCPESRTTTFLNCGKWELRKGHDILLTAFNKAFNASNDVKLVMHCYNPFPGPRGDVNKEWESIYLKSKLGREGKIHISNKRLNTQHELAMLMRQADCGVFPSRAEGWNLELLEMMSMSKPVIATNYSAHTEYINSDNALLIPVQHTELANDGIWFHGQGAWAKIGESEIEVLIEHMRTIHRMKQEGAMLRNPAGVATAKAFGWQNTISCIIERLQA